MYTDHVSDGKPGPRRPLMKEPSGRDGLAARDWSTVLSHDGLIILTAFLVAVACWAWGERVTVNGGFGWDGVTYGKWARSFRQEVLRTGVDYYLIQRILPAGTVNFSLRLLGIARTDANTLRAFCLLNVFLLTLTAAAWCGCARALGISSAGKWLGLVGLSLGYIGLKYAFFCPVTTDTTALALGMLMLYCHLHNRRILLGVVTLLGMFSWPMCIYTGALLLIFPRPGPNEERSGQAPGQLHLLGAAFLAGAALVGMKIAFRVPGNIASTLVEPQFLEPLPGWRNLGLILCLTYLFLGSFFLLNSRQLFQWSSLVSRQRLATLLIVLLVAGAARLVQHRLACSDSMHSLPMFLRQTAYTAVARPGIFLVTHVAFYGPVFVLTVLLWPAVCRHIHAQGPGLTLAVLFGLLLSTNSQSRFFINIFVLVIPFVVRATDELGWDRRQYLLITVASLFLSRIWLTINFAPFTGNLLEPPDQYFFMAHGPWVSTVSYVGQGAVFLALTALIYRSCVWGRTMQQQDNRPASGLRAA